MSKSLDIGGAHSIRLRRSAVDSRDPADQRPRAGKRKTYVIDDHPVEVHVGAGGWRGMEAMGSRALLHRNIHVTVGDGKARWAEMSFVGWRLKDFLSDNEIWEHFDSESVATAAFGDMLLALDEDDLCDFMLEGDIIEFERARVKPGHGDLWAEIAEAVVADFFPNHLALVIKPFPLEFEGKGSPQADVAIRRRVKAMVRHYGRLFGVRPVYQTDRARWLWRPGPAAVGNDEVWAFMSRDRKQPLDFDSDDA